LPWLAEAAAFLLTFFIVVAGWRRDFHVRLAFSYDALEYAMQVKGTIENGWWWVHPRLSAPGRFAQISCPSNTFFGGAMRGAQRAGKSRRTLTALTDSP